MLISMSVAYVRDGFPKMLSWLPGCWPSPPGVPVGGDFRTAESVTADSAEIAGSCRKISDRPRDPLSLRSTLPDVAAGAAARRAARLLLCSFAAVAASAALPLAAQTVDARQTETYRMLKSHFDSVAAISTHDHLRPFETLRGPVQTSRGLGMTLHSLWAFGYFPWVNPLTPWPESGKFDEWWAKAKHDFANARATGVYRYLLPAFQDLYDVDFETITDEQARALDGRIFAHYQDRRWLDTVVTERANIELMLIDPYWDRFNFTPPHRYAVPVLNVTTLIRGTHPAAFPPHESITRFAAGETLPLATLDDYVAVIERWLEKGKAAGAICLKSTIAYYRTLQFEKASKEEAAKAYGRPRGQLTASEIKAFEDYIMWRIAELSAKLELPFQIHTGHARVQGSNPIFLVDLIAAHPKTKFVLFHGGFPWIGETGVIASRHCHPNVWIDSNWLPTLSYTAARRAYQEWLEVLPSNRIMWGARQPSCRGHLRRGGSHPPVPRGSVYGEDHARRAARGARPAHRPANPPRQRAGALPAPEGAVVEKPKRSTG